MRTAITLWLALVSLLFGGCTTIDARTTRAIEETGKTMGAAYVALLGTMAAHEVGHWQRDLIYTRGAEDLTIATRFYRPWEIRPSGDIGVDWKTKRDRSRFFWTRPIPKAIRDRQERRNISGELSGILMTNRFFLSYNQSLKTGEIHGRTAHAFALFTGLDPIVYAVRDYHYFFEGEYGDGDLRDYVMDSGINRRSFLREAAIVDIVGKLPDLWWHARGMCGIEAPPPTFWRVGECDIRTGLVIVEWQAGIGITLMKRF